jgi:hypothetical protein
MNTAIKPDAQGFDEVRIITIPRYKQSGLSGDEWRICAEVQFYRNQTLICSYTCRNIETACGMLYSYLMTALDNGNGYFAGDGIHCDQEGCSKIATIHYKKKNDYCHEAHKTELTIDTFRNFCEEHKVRGNCSFDDSDDNYELMDIPKRS